MRQLHPLFVGEVGRADVGHPYKWRAGDLVIWDDRCPMHHGRMFDEREVRDLRRVTTRDVASTLEQVG